MARTGRKAGERITRRVASTARRAAFLHNDKRARSRVLRRCGFEGSGGQLQKRASQRRLRSAMRSAATRTDASRTLATLDASALHLQWAAVLNDISEDRLVRIHFRASRFR
eukprot:3133252-Pleurochrysis_carterae.AAC.2